MSSSSVIQHIQQTVTHLELLNHYNRLRQLVADHDPDLEAFLAAQELTAKRGVDWRSALNTYLARSLKISTVALQNRAQAAIGIFGLIDQFGLRVIVILPPSAAGK
jgi:hypothetical protein